MLRGILALRPNSELVRPYLLLSLSLSNECDGCDGCGFCNCVTRGLRDSLDDACFPRIPAAGARGREGGREGGQARDVSLHAVSQPAAARMKRLGLGSS